MKHVVGLYMVMGIMVFVTLTSEFVFNSNYSAIASWCIVMLFLFGTVFFANARYYLSEK